MNQNGIRSLQVMRCFAALAVVIHHSCRLVTVNKGGLVMGSPWLSDIPAFRQFGAAGVDLFFVLSGFLMIYISGPYVTRRKSAGNFLLQRFVRIWPMYVVATCWYLYPVIRGWLQGTPLPFDLYPVRLASLAFVPSANGNGLVQPILGVGWTLNYEFAFYLAFAAALIIPRGRLIWKLSALLVAGHVLGLLLPEHSTASRFLANSIVAEFVFGALIAEYWTRGSLRMPPYLPLCAGLLVLLVSAIYEPLEYWRFATTGVGAAMVFIGFLNSERRVEWPRLLDELGNASYSIYLVHIIVLYNYGQPVLARLAARGLVLPADVAALGLVVASTVVGYLAYRFVETPLLTLARRLFAATQTAGRPAVT